MDATILNIEHDTRIDAMYIQFSESPVAYSVELHQDCILDVDDTGTVVGIDIQRVSEWVDQEQHFQAVSHIAPSRETQSMYGPPYGKADTGRIIYQPA